MKIKESTHNEMTGFSTVMILEFFKASAYNIISRFLIYSKIHNFPTQNSIYLHL